MTENADSGRDPESAEERSRCAAARAGEAHQNARELAGRLAETGDAIAETLDRLADTREQVAERRGVDTGHERELAQRARDRAEGERRDSSQLREKWNPPER